MAIIRIRVEIGALSTVECRKLDLLIKEYKLTRRTIQHDDPFERPSRIMYVVQVAQCTAQVDAHLRAEIAQHIGKDVRLEIETILA
jgi:hypothetical protein